MWNADLVGKVHKMLNSKPLMQTATVKKKCLSLCVRKSTLSMRVEGEREKAREREREREAERQRYIDTDRQTGQRAYIQM